jgi:hypothetical protein
MILGDMVQGFNVKRYSLIVILSDFLYLKCKLRLLFDKVILIFLMQSDTYSFDSKGFKRLSSNETMKNKVIQTILILVN